MSNYTFELEEIGSVDSIYVKADIEYDATEGGPGSYWEPPSPPEFEITNVTVIEFGNETQLLKREDRPDWFDWLDEIVFRILESNDDYEIEIAENHEPYDGIYGTY